MIILYWNQLISLFFFSDPHQKDDINKKAFDKFKKEHGAMPQAEIATPSERFEGKYAKTLFQYSGKQSSSKSHLVRTVPTKDPLVFNGDQSSKNQGRSSAL